MTYLITVALPDSLSQEEVSERLNFGAEVLKGIEGLEVVKLSRLVTKESKNDKLSPNGT